MSSRWGRQFQISIFGESHGAGIGVVIDGVPAGFTLDLEELYAFLKRRAPGRNRASTPRQESDLPELVSGVQDGRTTGAPLTALIRNSDQHSKDYSELASTARPGHADYTGYLRYAGCNDVRGGGHFSGRLTAPLCFAGGVARQLLAARGVLVGAHAARIAGIDDAPFDPVGLDATTLLAPGKAEIPVLDPESGRRMLDAIELARMEQDSVGGVVECAVLGMPAGVGSPMFDGLENRIASIVFGIPAVKGIEFGAGFNAAELRGSQNNDPFRIRDGRVVCSTNHAGGILGGISNGMPILFRAAFKPTPSISQPQQTVDFVRHTERDLTVHGRHDPCVVLRAVPVVEAAAAIAAADCLLEADGYRHC
ncbi:MAG: chorismate synthase [Anaerotruncus sp.]|nr:chorismate synthase [Anaerotruncus sp.]